MVVRKFEDLICWQKARELTKEIYRVTNNTNFSKDYGLKNQIQRACVSIMSNIADGYERGTTDELIQFLYVACGSCGEVRTQLYVAYDQNYISLEEFQKLQKLAMEVSRLIYHFIEYFKKTSIRGQKFKKPLYKSFREEVQEWLKQYQLKISETAEDDKIDETL